MNLRKYFAIALVAFLVGCGGQFTVHPTSQENVLTNPATATQNLIDEANAGIAAAAQTVLANSRTGAISRDDERAYLGKLEQAATYLDNAQAFLKNGDPTSAQGQLNLANAALTFVQGELIKLKNQGSK